MAPRGGGRAPAAALVLLLAPALLPALAAEPAEQALPEPGTAARALADAEAHRAELGLLPGAELRVAGRSQSLTGEHVGLAQFVGGARVLDGGLGYHFGRDGALLALVNGLAPLPAGSVPPPALPAEAAVRAALAALGGPALRAPAQVELLLVPGEAGALPALVWRVALPAAAPLRDWVADLDALTGALLGVRDAMLHAEGTGSVFLTNPIVNSGDPDLRDNPLGLNSPELQAEAREVALRGLDEAPGQQGRLQGPYVQVLGAAFEPALRFHYARDDPRFEEVMAYHHIDSAQRLLQGLGYTDLVQRPVPVTMYPGEVNAFYSRVTRTIHLGYHARDTTMPQSGFADAGEDAEVIVHEYGHAVLDDAVPGLANEHGEALHEGFADFFAASLLSRVSQGRFDACVAEWMSQYVTQGSPPCVRRLDNDRTFPGDFHSGLLADPHENGLIWSGALWDLWQRFPREDVERLALEAHFFLSTFPRMPDAGRGLLLANRALGSPLPEPAILDVLASRGLLPPGSLAPQDDAGSGRDAGNHYRAALPLGSGSYAGRVGAHGDREDWYAIALQAGDLLVLDVNSPSTSAPALVPPSDAPFHGMSAAAAGRLAAPAQRALRPWYGCGSGAGELRFHALATEPGLWRLSVPEPADNDPASPDEVAYAFRVRVTRDYGQALPRPEPEVGQAEVRAGPDDSVYVRLEGAGSAGVTAPSGRSLLIAKEPSNGVVVAHVALDGRVLGVRLVAGQPAGVSALGSLAGEPADGTWVVRKALDQFASKAQGVQLRVAGKVLDDVAPAGDPIEGSGTGGPAAMLTPLTAWNWHRSPERFDVEAGDALVPRPPVSPACPRLLVG